MLHVLFTMIKVALIGATLGGSIWFVQTKLMGHNRLVCLQEKLPEGKVCPETVFDAWKDQKVVWIDARPLDSFERGTVKTQNVRPLRMDENYQKLLGEAMEALFLADKIIVFCDKSCTSSSDIAKRLKDPELGIEGEIYVLEGGWDAIERFQERQR